MDVLTGSQSRKDHRAVIARTWVVTGKFAQPVISTTFDDWRWRLIQGSERLLLVRGFVRFLDLFPSARVCSLCSVQACSQSRLPSEVIVLRVVCAASRPCCAAAAWRWVLSSARSLWPPPRCRYLGLWPAVDGFRSGMYRSSIPGLLYTLPSSIPDLLYTLPLSAPVPPRPNSGHGLSQASQKAN